MRVRRVIAGLGIPRPCRRRGRSPPSPTITPDPGTGIGRRSQAAFARTLREGVDRAGRQLDPAFPYDHHGATTDDVRALYAFFMTCQAVAGTAAPNGLPVPLNLRVTLAGWKRLSPRPKDLAPGPGKDEACTAATTSLRASAMLREEFGLNAAKFGAEGARSREPARGVGCHQGCGAGKAALPRRRR
ncbi:hypothetical protein DA075_04430 [Methylobacterium currus]|uniref:Uncharacterized protein n=1 Tax=Methylobacterium currus TaxID=2051553 RepID=A0A2R4WFG2_9HYPH|nr:hypothetical protein [Methylobacterium currus]AWB20275.1 hypothetical protein DA075_04430 [Methylobacterium currus]